MCLAGVLPVVYFAIDDLTGEKRKWRAFKRFVYFKRFPIIAAIVFYAVCSLFAVHFGWDVLTSLNALTPVPAAGCFGIGLGVGIAILLKDGE